MANTDVTITLAGQFAPLDPKQVKLVELAGKAAIALNQSTKPTVAQWNTFLTTAIGLFPPACKRDMRCQRAAVYWQSAVGTLGTGLIVAGRSNSQILDLTSPLQGLTDAELDALSTYLEGKGCLLTSVFT